MKKFYHGTLSKNIDNIKKFGLLIDPPTNFKHVHGFSTEKQISLSTNYNEAFYYISLFANKNPITILIIELEDDFKLYDGLSDIEKVSKVNILLKNIKGAYDKEEFIKLKNLENNKNNINYNLLRGRDKDVALKYYKEEIRLTMSKLNKYLEMAKYDRRYDKPGWSILPIGAINLKTGKNQYINVLDDTGAMILVKSMTGQYKLVCGAGSPDGYGKMDDYVTLYHDQTMNNFGNPVSWKIVGQFKTNQEGLDNVAKICGKNSVAGAVFK